jgi:hypothetical protein
MGNSQSSMAPMKVKNSIGNPAASMAAVSFVAAAAMTSLYHWSTGDMLPQNRPTKAAISNSATITNAAVV